MDLYILFLAENAVYHVFYARFGEVHLQLR